MFNVVRFYLEPWEQLLQCSEGGGFRQREHISCDLRSQSLPLGAVNLKWYFRESFN